MKKMISCITAAVLFCTAIIPAAAESAEPENPTILRDESAMFCDIIPLFEQKYKEMSPEEQAHYDFFYTPDSSSGYNHPKDDTLANGWGASLWLSYTDSAVCGFNFR